MSNRIEGTRRKLSHMPTGRLKPLRLFSTLLLSSWELSGFSLEAVEVKIPTLSLKTREGWGTLGPLPFPPLLPLLLLLFSFLIVFG